MDHGVIFSRRLRDLGSPMMRVFLSLIVLQSRESYFFSPVCDKTQHSVPRSPPPLSLVLQGADNCARAWPISV
jgi:hypothetical protein